MTLDQFVAEKLAEIEAFKARWLEAHAKDPEAYPLDMPDYDAGLWDEQLSDFDMTAGPFEVPEDDDD